MTQIEKLTNMAKYVENKLLAELSNEIYHEFKDEEYEFKNLQLNFITPAIEQASREYIVYIAKKINAEEENNKLTKIYEQLVQWKNERHLTVESQQKNLIGNVLEELTELARAQNDEEKVDCYCDIVVFSLNACKELPTEVSSCWFPLRDANKELDSFCEMIINQLHYDINRVIAMCFYNLKLLGYDPYDCMNETIKEINSRTGHYDESISKFIKDTSDEAKSKWYKANYSKCRLKEREG